MKEDKDLLYCAARIRKVNEHLTRLGVAVDSHARIAETLAERLEGLQTSSNSHDIAAVLKLLFEYHNSRPIGLLNMTPVQVGAVSILTIRVLAAEFGERLRASLEHVEPNMKQKSANLLRSIDRALTARKQG